MNNTKCVQKYLSTTDHTYPQVQEVVQILKDSGFEKDLNNWTVRELAEHYMFDNKSEVLECTDHMNDVILSAMDDKELDCDKYTYTVRLSKL